jgi:hypothetical protein
MTSTMNWCDILRFVLCSVVVDVMKQNAIISIA